MINVLICSECGKRSMVFVKGEGEKAIHECKICKKTTIHGVENCMMVYLPKKIKLDEDSKMGRVLVDPMNEGVQMSYLVSECETDYPSEEIQAFMERVVELWNSQKPKECFWCKKETSVWKYPVKPDKDPCSTKGYAVTHGICESCEKWWLQEEK